MNRDNSFPYEEMILMWIKVSGWFWEFRSIKIFYPEDELILENVRFLNSFLISFYLFDKYFKYIYICEPSQIYIGLTKNTFKARFTNHKASFNNLNKWLNTELSKYIWKLKEKEKPYQITWKFLKHTSAYNPSSNRCNHVFGRNFS